MSKQRIDGLVLAVFAAMVLLSISVTWAGEDPNVPAAADPNQMSLSEKLQTLPPGATLQVIRYSVDAYGKVVRTISRFPRPTIWMVSESDCPPAMSDFEAAAEALAQVPEILWPIVQLQAKAIKQADEGL